MTASIKLFDVNAIDSFATYAATSIDLDTVANLYDRDKTSKVVSTTLVSSGTEVLTITFDAPKTINTIAIFGHNIKTGTIKYLNSSLVATAFSTPISFSNNTATDNVYYFNESLAGSDIEAYGIQISVTAAIGTVELKISGLYAIRLFYNLAAPATFVPSFLVEANFKNKADGGPDKLIQGVKKQASMEFDYLTDADCTQLLELSYYPRPFHFYIAPLSTQQTKPFFLIDDLVLCIMTNNFQPRLIKDHIVDNVHWEGELEINEV